MASVSFQGSVYTSWGTQTADVIVNYSESYNVSTNKTSVSVTGVQFRVQGGTNWGTQIIKGSVAINGTTVCSFSPGSSTATQITVDGSYTTLPGSTGSAEVAHNDDGTGSFTLSLREAVDGDVGGIFGFWYSALGAKIGIETPVSRTVSLTARPRASAIASCPSSVATQGKLDLTVSRNSSAFYHKATFTSGGRTLFTSGAFATTLTFTVPRTWFSNFTSATSLPVTVSVQTYTNSSCTTAVGSAVTRSLTVTADSGMKPVVSSGWVTLSPYNTGAIASISGYVKSYSRAQATFNSAKISMSNTAGASISSYSITCQGTTDSSSPYQTPVLTSTSVSVTCTVTDSRGRTASQAFTLSVYDYSKPSLSGISVFRCTANGTASEDGTYYSAKATSTFSSLNGQNTCTIKVSHAQSGGSYGTEYTLTSGTARVIGSLSVDKSYTVRIIATDSLGNSVTYTASIPTKTWAMKFRPNGQGVAFGKAAEYDKTFEIADDWYLRYNNYIPLNNVVNKIPSGADLNDYDLPGVYAIGSSSTAATIANIPQQSAGTLRVFASAGAAITASSTWKYLIQEYIVYTGERYQRYGESGSGTAVTWRAWHQQIRDYEIGNAIKTAAFTSSTFTIAAGGYSSIDIPVSLSGFTPIGIVSITGSGNGNASIIEFNLASSTSVRIYARNNTSSAITINYYRVTVLFIKSA